MVIKASAAVEIRRLIAALGDDDDVRREAAIARLAVLGARAVERLLAAYESTGDRQIRIAILRALESVGDRRLVPLARQALSAGGDLGVAAASALRALLDSPHGSAAGGALDVLVAAALDPAADRRVRLAAFEALQDMPPGVRARVAEALQADPDAGLKARAVDLPRDTAAAEAVWQDALEGRLPDSPAMLREAAFAREKDPCGRRRNGRNGRPSAGRSTRRWRCAAAAWPCTTCAKRSRRRKGRSRSLSSLPCTSSATRRASSRLRGRIRGPGRATPAGAISSARRSEQSAAGKRSRGGTP
jgi:hypothetical protein